VVLDADNEMTIFDDFAGLTDDGPGARAGGPQTEALIIEIADALRREVHRGAGHLMATTSETIYTHTSDLCGQVRDEEDLRKLCTKPQPRGGSGFLAPVYKTIDICPGCESRPVSEVLAFLGSSASRAVKV
jgi:hypothetical protein